MFEETLDFQSQHQQQLNEIPDRKTFAVNLPSELFLTKVTNADIGSLKCLSRFEVLKVCTAC